MRLFIDSGDLEAIKRWSAAGIVDGVTTNPSILAKEAPDANVFDHIARIAREVPLVSVQLRSRDDNPQSFLEISDNVIVKCPITWLDRMAYIPTERLNVTAVLDADQALLASRVAPRIISVFWCRARDADLDPAKVVRFARDVTTEATEILVGSIRDGLDVQLARDAGADIATVPKAVLEAMLEHAGTTKILREWYGEAA